MSAYTCDYTVYGLDVVDGQDITRLIADFDSYENACRVARYCMRLGIQKAEVYFRLGFGGYDMVYTISSDEYCCDDVLESLRQLREAGALMPDPEDSSFFATPCEPMAVI